MKGERAGDLTSLVGGSTHTPMHLASAETPDDARWPSASPVSKLVERVVFLSDSALPIPGTSLRVGLDPIIGLLFPGGGDAVGGAISLSVLFLALQKRLPTWVVARMVGNLALDAAVGVVPLVGDVFDFGFRANQRNLDILRAHAERPLPARMPARYWLGVALLLTAAVVCICLPIVLSAYLVYVFFRGQA